MLYEIVHLIVDFVGALLVGACLLRAWMQRQRVGARSPLGQFVMALTDWLVRPLRRVIAGHAGIDWASLVAALLISLAASVLLFGMAALAGAGTLPPVELVVGMALIWLIKWTLYMIQMLVLISAVLSWVNPFSPLMPVIDALTVPLLRPVRRLLPMIGRFDLSPVVVLLAIQVGLIVLRGISVETFGTF